MTELEKQEYNKQGIDTLKLFLSFLSGKNYTIAEVTTETIPSLIPDKPAKQIEQLVHIQESDKKLIAEFFKIDLEKLDIELDREIKRVLATM